MNLDEKILARFSELVALGQSVLMTDNQGYVDSQFSRQWATSSLNLLSKIPGKDSDHYAQFKEQISAIFYAANSMQALGILRAAKDDYEKGMLFDTRALIEGDVFGDFLEQADHLLQNKYPGPAAVIAGSVLEDGLRKLCNRHNVQLPPDATLTPMNDALPKAGAYSKLVHDQLVPVIRLRNDAAHGKWDQFTRDDVQKMIDQVRDFMVRHFS